MQKITFRTVSGKTVTITDDNTSSYMGSYIPVHLLSFEGNSVGVIYDQQERIGHDGFGVYGAKTNARTIELELALLPHDGQEYSMYALRRQVLGCFPPGEEGTLTYNNGNGDCQIECFVNEYPGIERDAGVLCTTKLYLTASNPFWRKKAADVEISMNSAVGIHGSFTSDTEIAVPVAFEVQNNMGGITQAALMIVNNDVNYKYDSFDAEKEPRATIVQAHKTVYFTSALAQGDEFVADFGILGNMNITSGYEDRIDFLRTSTPYIRHGTNEYTLSVSGQVSGGILKIKIFGYNYIRAV